MTSDFEDICIHRPANDFDRPRSEAHRTGRALLCAITDAELDRQRPRREGNGALGFLIIIIVGSIGWGGLLYAIFGR